MKPGSILFTALFVACAGFIDWRLWVSLSSKTAAIRGGSYSRDAQPVSYWVVIALMIIAALMFSGIALLFVVGLSLGWIA